MMNEARKRLFIVLLGCSFLVLGVLFIFAWWLVSKQYLMLNQIILTLALVFFIVVFLMIGIGVAALVYSLWSFKNFKFLNKLIRAVIDFLFPFAIKIGQWFGIEKDKIKNSYIQVSNQLVKLEQPTIVANDILILAPHCLQRVQCPHKITVDVSNCKVCGLCPVGSLVTLSQEKGVRLVVVTGGTFARKFIKEIRPRGLVAIACERDLTSGIQDVEKIPVIGVINDRPEGPCYNTKVQLCRVEQAIDYFIQGGEV